MATVSRARSASGVGGTRSRVGDDDRNAPRGCGMVTVEDVRRIAGALPRSEEHLIRDRVKFRVGRIVFVALSRDETVMGFGFPKEERAALVDSEPDKFAMPAASDLRYNWVHVRLDAIDEEELRELIVDAWRMVVPKSVAAAYEADLSPPPSLTSSWAAACRECAGSSGRRGRR
jgi:hypothetical protein